MTTEAEYDKFSFDKECVDLEMLQKMHPAIVMIIAWTNLWCHSHGVKAHWTSLQRTHEENQALGATDVHIYRAADLSTKTKWGWTPALRTKYANLIRSKFLMMGSIIKREKDGVNFRRVIVRHDVGHGDHFHLQVAPTAEVFNEKHVVMRGKADVIRLDAGLRQELRNQKNITRKLHKDVADTAKAKLNMDKRAIELAKLKEEYNISKGYLR